MKYHMSMLVASCLVGMVLHASEKQEMDQKIHHEAALILSDQDKRDAASFWQAEAIFVSDGDGFKQNAPFTVLTKGSVEIMRYVINKNPRVLGIGRKPSVLGVVHESFASPLAWLADVTAQDTEHFATLDFLREVAHKDNNNQRRLNALLCAVTRNSPVVAKLLIVEVGTDITKEPRLLTNLVERCRKGGIIAAQQSNAAQKNSAGRDFELVSLLLHHKADISGVMKMRDRPHLKVDDCLSCKLIFDCVDDRIELLDAPRIMPQPSAPPAPASLYPAIAPFAAAAPQQASLPRRSLGKDKSACRCPGCSGSPVVRSQRSLSHPSAPLAVAALPAPMSSSPSAAGEEAAKK